MVSFQGIFECLCGCRYCSMQLSRGGDSLRASDIAYGRNNSGYAGYLGLDTIIDQRGVRCWIGRDHDALSFMGKRLPDFLGDEWHERMQESQQRFEALDQGRARQGSLACGLVGESRLHKLYVPVTVLMPDELIERVRSFVESVGPQRSIHFANAAMQPAEDPPVRGWPFGDRRVGPRTFQVHQNEPCRVPEFVRKVPIPFDALLR